MNAKMEMTVVDGRPPNFDKIIKVFPLASRAGVMFAYGWTLYAPGFTARTVPDELLYAHEPVHAIQHTTYEGGIGAWWDRYMEDIDFRFSQELPAHVAEFRYLVSLAHARKRALRETAEKLAAPLYGSMRSVEECQRLIAEAD